MALLSIEHYSLEYRLGNSYGRVLDDITLTLGKGEIFGLAGESGCGKTSLGSAILGTIPEGARHAGGKIVFDNRELTAMTEKELCTLRWKDMSMVFQGAMNAFDPTMTIEKQIADAVLVHEPKCRKKEAVERARNIMSRCEVNPALGKRYPHELSGGMRQRACIAMALVLSPKLVIADEVTTALDVMIQAQVYRVLKNLQEEMGLTILTISHDLALLAECADRLGIMYAGRLVELGDTRKIIESPQHPYVKALLASNPDFGGERIIRPAIEGAPPLLTERKPGCPFKPRCSVAQSDCHINTPELVEVSTNHWVACPCCLHSNSGKGNDHE
ncbi:ABC transporter ATP-binding protein [bacterium]|nr:ABC transporter ATP-binding protein [bacterium]